ncbi:hypothetical protein AGMMS4952_27710 [Spirochaetia bacterium]|nr:hypothetical protein AGMMS4952_27710 [Spirochaetia bacterium]
MKKRVAIMAGAALGMAFMVLAGCASLKLGSKGKDPVMLDHAGRAWGGKELPPWLETWNTSHSIIAVEKMPEYRGRYCFIAEDTGSNLKAVQAWLNTVAINNIIGSQISTRIGSVAEANVNTANNASYTNKLNDVMTTTRNATYTAAVKESDYWVKWRNYDPDDKTNYTDEYTATILYTMQKDILNEQIANEFRTIQNNANTKEEREMWTGLIQAVLERGLDVEARTPARNDNDVNITVFN